MRVIEQKMIAAITNGRAMHNGNTAVEVGALGNWRVRLHGNLIATGGRESFSVTLAGWNTPTTRSRVNTLLRELGTSNGRVFCHQFAPYYTTDLTRRGAERVIDSHEWIPAVRN